MSHRRTTFSKFIIEQQPPNDPSGTQLTALLNDVQTACKFIALAVSRGALHESPPESPFGDLANEIVSTECAQGGTLGAMASAERDAPTPIPEGYSRGPYLLAFDPLDGGSNLDINVPVGTIFSVLRAPAGVENAEAADFLQPGNRQVAAGFALYGPCSMIVLTMGDGVHGFTLDRHIGAYTLTHPNMRIAEETREFAINATNERFWEPPVRHYVAECIKGQDGERGEDFNMRWVASMVAEVHRILIRGGIFMFPRDTKDPASAGRLQLLFEAAPMAMIVEQAGGLATTGRERLLDLVPSNLHQRVPVILGSRREVERLLDYHAAYDRGEDLTFDVPLFNTRSLFRSA
jgi:fructose-1,6-bisphosphatase I